VHPVAEPWGPAQPGLYLVQNHLGSARQVENPPRPRSQGKGVKIGNQGRRGGRCPKPAPAAVDGGPRSTSSDGGSCHGRWQTRCPSPGRKGAGGTPRFRVAGVQLAGDVRRGPWPGAVARGAGNKAGREGPPVEPASTGRRERAAGVPAGKAPPGPWVNRRAWEFPPVSGYGPGGAPRASGAKDCPSRPPEPGAAGKPLLGSDSPRCFVTAGLDVFTAAKGGAVVKGAVSHRGYRFHGEVVTRRSPGSEAETGGRNRRGHWAPRPGKKAGPSYPGRPGLAGQGPGRHRAATRSGPGYATFAGAKALCREALGGQGAGPPPGARARLRTNGFPSQGGMGVGGCAGPG